MTVNDRTPLICTTCGSETEGRQWKNCHPWYGICSSCAYWLTISSNYTSKWLYREYGIEGFHFFPKKPEETMLKQAILVKWLPVTNHKPSRWKATSADGMSVIVSCDGSTHDYGQRAVAALCKKLGWDAECFVVGQCVGGQYVYVQKHGSPELTVNL